MTRADIDAVIPMRCALFPDCPAAQQRIELEHSLVCDAAPGTLGNQACIVVEDEGGMIGFAEVQLRSHAEGCWEITEGGDLGVAYLEAWWVEARARQSGVGRALVEACVSWARAQGSRVLASDAEPENARSQRAHEALGFVEVGRSVHYTKAV